MPSALIDASRTTPPLLPSRRIANDIAAQPQTENMNQLASGFLVQEKSRFYDHGSYQCAEFTFPDFAGQN